MLPIDLDEAKRHLTMLESELREVFKDRDAAVDRMRDLYFLEHHKGRVFEDGETPVTTGKATNAVDLTVGILSSNPMKIKAYSLGETEDSEENATQVEKFLKGVTYINNERQETTIEVGVITCQVRDAWACLFSYWDGEVALKEKAYDELPATIELIDIKEVFYKKGGPRGGYRLFVRSCMRTVQDIEDEWGVLVDGYEALDAKKTKVRYVDYWGWTRADVPVGEEVDEEGEPVTESKWVVENAILVNSKTWIKEPEYMWHYKDLPFTLVPGRLTNDSRTDREALSVLFPIEPSIKDYETQLIHHRRLTDLYSSLPPVVTTKMGEEPPGVDAVIGKVVILKDGEKFEFPHWPGSPPDLEKSIQRLENEIQQGTYPNSQYGSGPDGSSGYGLSLMNESGRIRLQQFQKNLERSWAIVFRKILSLAAEFAPNQNLPVYGNLSGRPFMLNVVGGEMRGYRVDVEIKPQFPQEEARNVTMATQIKAQGLLSDKSIQERYLGVDYPDVEMDRKLYEAAMQNPELLRAKIMEVVREVDPGLANILNPPPQPPQSASPPQQATIEQNNRATGTMGQPPAMPVPGELPPSAIMPQEMAGIMPPQGLGQPAPGQQLPPELMQILMQIGGGPGVR